jgi:hypothetical protein
MKGESHYECFVQEFGATIDALENAKRPKPFSALSFDEKVARKEAYRAKLTTETRDPDLDALRSFSQTDKAKNVRKRFMEWRAKK